MNKSGRSSLATTIWIFALIVVALGAVVLVKITSGSSSSTKSGVASSALVDKVTKLDSAVFTKVGEGTANKLPSVVADGTDYTKDGKPAVLYLGAEYCPYCATERWPVVIALSRFGTFTNLGTTSSSATDAYPSTASLSFHGSSYKSDYLTFTGVEETSNQPQGTGYAPLDTPTDEEKALVTKYDAAPYVSASSVGSIPFIYFGGKYVMVGSSYDPTVLQGKSADEIASSLSSPSSDISKGAVGAANTITATLCKLTNNQPANVCTSKTIMDLQTKLGS